MRPLLPLAALLIASAAPVAAAPRSAPPVRVLLVADVTEGAQQSMPATLWRRLATEYVGTGAVGAEDGTALPDDAHCRGAHALYAVLATFERATRLPGLAQDTDRSYGIARFTVRNCLTGAVSPTKTVRLESDPLAAAERGFEANGERTWERAVRTTLARDPLMLTAIARIARIDDGVVFLESGSAFVANQMLRDVADPAAKPHAAPILLVVRDATGKYVAASVVGKGTPHVGDYVEAAPTTK